jgi:hypothetical protein
MPLLDALYTCCGQDKTTSPRYADLKKEVSLNWLIKNCLLEILVNSGLTATSRLFASSDMHRSLITFSVTSTALNILLKCSSVGLRYRSHHILHDDLQSIELKKALDSISETFDWLVPFNFALLFSSTGSVLIHEAGHALAAFLLYKNAHPQISIHSLFEGNTTWINQGLSPLGSLLGEPQVKFLALSVGPLAIVLAASAGFLSAIQLQKSYPKVSKCACFAALFSLVYHIRYALSALTASKPNMAHDFVQLWNYGIHPLTAAGFIAGVPLAFVLGFSNFKNT